MNNSYFGMRLYRTFRMKFAERKNEIFFSKIEKFGSHFKYKVANNMIETYGYQDAHHNARLLKFNARIIFGKRFFNFTFLNWHQIIVSQSRNRFFSKKRTHRKCVHSSNLCLFFPLRLHFFSA